MNIVVVYNQHSGSALPLDELVTKFKANNLTVTGTIPIGDGLRSQLQPHLDRKDIVVVAYGGDGTINAVASLLAGTSTVFAPLPGGTLNHFTKDLAIAQDLDEAINDWQLTQPRQVDIAYVNDRAILNNSSIGLYPVALQMRDDIEKKRIGKWPAAIIASFRAFVRYRSYTVTIDGETFKTPFIFVGNNDYRLEHQFIGERVRLDEGVLSVYAITHTGRARLLWMFLRAIAHKLEDADDIKIWKTQQLTIHTKRSRVRVSRDGEHEKLRTPLEYKIALKSLTILGGS